MTSRRTTFVNLIYLAAIMLLTTFWLLSESRRGHLQDRHDQLILTNDSLHVELIRLNEFNTLLQQEVDSLQHIANP